MPPWRSRPSVIPLLGSTFLSQSGSAWNRLGYDGRKNAIERITTTPSSANRPPTFFMPASLVHHSLFFIIRPEPCDVVALNFDLRVVSDLKRHGLPAQVGDGPPEAGRGDDLVPLLQGLQHGFELLLASLMRKDQQEIEDHEDQDERHQGQPRAPRPAPSRRSLRPGHGVQQPHPCPSPHDAGARTSSVPTVATSPHSAATPARRA